LLGYRVLEFNSKNSANSINAINSAIGDIVKRWRSAERKINQILGKMPAKPYVLVFEQNI
jgi:hypothetical protein